MRNYLLVARAYLGATPIAVWCLLLLGLVLVSAADGQPRHPSNLVGNVLVRPSYLALFTYVNACLLGVLLRDHLAHPWASLLPHYRLRHLLVAMLLAGVFLGIPTLMIAWVGPSELAPTSAVVIFLSCLAAGLWTLHHPALGILALPWMLFILTPSSASPALAAFLIGTTPGISAALTSVSLLALGALAWRLLALQEEGMEYLIARRWGDLLRGRGSLFRGQALTVSDGPPTAPTQRYGVVRLLDAWSRATSQLQTIDHFSGYSERNLWQRVQLWRLGTAPTRTSASVAWLLLVTLVVVSSGILIQRVAGFPLPARDIVVIFSIQVMMNPFSRWLFWFLRRSRLSEESLRPRTRPAFVRELGLALLVDVVQYWLGGILLLALAGTLWAPELLQSKHLLLFALCTGIGQLATCALLALEPGGRGTATSLMGVCIAFLGMAQWMLWAMNGNPRIEVHLLIALVLAVVAGAALPLAYHHWCRADLA